MGAIIVKLFATVLADRLRGWASDNDRLSPAKQSFLTHERCLEHSFVLQRIIESARIQKEEVVITWMDQADAFDSVSHAVIQDTLLAVSVRASVVETVMSLYQDLTDPIPMLSGVRQDCPLSPILFNLVIDPLVRRAGGSGAGFEIAGERISALAYADNVALIAASSTGMGELFSRRRGNSEVVGILLHPRKCATSGGRANRSQQPFRWRANICPSWSKGTFTSTLKSPRDFVSTILRTEPSSILTQLARHCSPRVRRLRLWLHFCCRASTSCCGVAQLVKAR